MLQNPSDAQFDQVLRSITVPGTTWTFSRSHTVRTCKRQELTDDAKLWFYFIRHSLMPTGHVSTVNQDRLFLIAAILDGSPINVGQIIEAQIRHCAARTAGEMFFPSLISFMCQRIGLTTSSPVQSSYIASTITMGDLRRILPAVETTPPPAAVAPTPSADLPAHDLSMSATASSSSTPPAVRDVASDFVSDHADPPDSPIDVSDMAMPGAPPTHSFSHTRRSNRVQARIISPSSRPKSSRRSQVRRRLPSLLSTVPPAIPPATVLTAPLASILVPSIGLPAVTVVPVSPSPPVSSVLHSPPLPPVFIPPAVPLVPPSPASTVPAPSPPSSSASPSSLPIPPVSGSMPSPPAPHPLRNRLVDILHTLANNQSLYYDYVTTRDTHLQVLLEQLFQRVFGIAPTPWPPAPNYHDLPKPDAPPSST